MYEKYCRFNNATCFCNSLVWPARYCFESGVNTNRLSRKSEKQKTAAYILLGSGVEIFTGSLIAHYNYANNHNNPFIDFTMVTARDVVATVSLFVAEGSIPYCFFKKQAKGSLRSYWYGKYAGITWSRGQQPIISCNGS